LPFDVEQMFYDSRAASKNFYFTRERLPAERVSLVSKGEMHHLVHRALEYLHHARGLPYAHLWYFPDGQRNLFAFRVDTDAAAQKDIDGLYRIAREHSISMSWYLDVKSHEPWLNHFSYMVNQEIGLHCYEHQTYEIYELNAKNMEAGLHAMRSHGLNPKGFAAPFGIWNTGLARAIDEHGFEYSSEFSYAYDTLPMYPADNGTLFSALQVPIHPISIGSLRRVGYSEEQMTSYYRMCVDQKLARCEPLFFYHHPTHRGYNIVEHLFQYVQEKGIGGTTLGDFASWWKKRAVSPLSLHLEGSMVRVELPDAFDASVHVRLTNASGYEAIVRPQTLLDLSSLVWTKSAPMPEVPSDIRRLRDFDPRATLGNLYNTLIRKLR
ncbi:MAG: hypothetical protein AAB393_18555, partial [Bacteroidota bacterium]